MPFRAGAAADRSAEQTVASTTNPLLRWPLIRRLGSGLQSLRRGCVGIQFANLPGPWVWQWLVLPGWLICGMWSASFSAEALQVPPEVLAAQAERVEVMRRAAAATVSIFGLDGGGGGSGVLISPDGFALTNYHVSSACGDHMRCGLNDGKMYDAVIVGIDAVGDVSLIQLLGRDDFPTAPMGDSDRVRVGQWCFSAGNPFGLATNRQPSISLGIVSGTGRYQYPAGTILEYADCIQTDAAVNPGNSGGPLFNMSGEIIGINGRCSFEKRGRINVGVGYAISINQIRNFLGLLHSGRLLDHATLGATVSTDDTGRVVVSNILSSSDAYRRGLRYGDQVLRFADREITTTNSFKNVLGSLPKDLRVPLEFRRGEQVETLLVRLAGVHSESQLIDIVGMGLEGPPPDSERPPRPGPVPQPGPAKEPEPNQPADVAPPAGKPNASLVQTMLETRAGFANYYYNRRHRQRLWSELQSLGDFAQSQRWRLAGRLAGEATEVKIVVSDGQAEIGLGSRRHEYLGDISDAVAERRQGGMVVALRALQDLLRLGPEKMGSTIYLGRLPVYPGQSWRLADQPWQDVLETAWQDAKVRFYWDDQQQQLSLIEVYGDEGHDPAELYLDNYQTFTDEVGGYRFPTRLRLQYGTQIMLLVELETVATDWTAQRQPTDLPPSPLKNSAAGDAADADPTLSSAPSTDDAIDNLPANAENDR